MRKTIFIAGIHGVGKSYICNLIKEHRQINIYSASDLIRKYQEDRTDINKKVPDIEKNQDVLIYSIIQNIPDKIEYILDGHFCLLNSDKKIIKVPRSTFEQLNIVGIITIYDKAEDIISRLQLRDDTDYSNDFINEFQLSEITYADEIASNFNIFNLKFQNDKDKLDVVIDYIDSLFGRKCYE